MYKTINILKELEKYPVFDNKTVRTAIKKDANYTKLFVHRLKNEGLIKEIERDLYTLQDDILVIASHIVWPCYLSLWTALRYHNLTEQLPQTLFVATTKQKRKVLNIQNTEIKFITIKPKYFFGYKKEQHNNFNIFIAEPEKALIDAVLLRRISITEIFDIIRNHVNEIDAKKIVDYILKVDNKAVTKRLGYILSASGKDIYKKLQILIDNKYIPLDIMLPKKGKKNKKWKIIENVTL